MLSNVARVEINVAKNYIAELNALFCLICWFSFEPLNMYIYVHMELLYVKLGMSGDVLVYRGKPHKDV